MITPAYALTATERVLPRMALDFTTGVLDPRVTVTRALNTATRVNSSGFVEVVNANLPRFDHDPATLAPRGLLIEEQRTNLVTYSEQFDNAAWVKTRVTVSANATTAPDGTSAADKIAETSDSGFHFVNQTSVSAVTAVAHTASVYVKAAERTWCILELGGTPFGCAVWFNLSNGTVGTQAGSPSSATITAAGNGWWRITMAKTATSVGTFTFGIYPTTGDNVASYTGTTGSGIFVYGAQLEAGAFATSYIPTTTLATLRNADDVTMTGTNFTSWYSASEGTFTSTFSAAASTASVLVTDAAGNGRPLYIISGGIVRIFDGTTPINAGGTYTFNTVSSAGSSYGGGTMSCALNGGTVGSGAFDGSMGTSALYIGRNPAQPNEYIKGHIQKVAFYPMRFSDRELQAFSK